MSDVDFELNKQELAERIDPSLAQDAPNRRTKHSGLVATLGSPASCSASAQFLFWNNGSPCARFFAGIRRGEVKLYNPG